MSVSIAANGALLCKLANLIEKSEADMRALFDESAKPFSA